MVDIVIQLLPRLLPHLLAALIYGYLGYHFWHTRWRETDKPRVTLPMTAAERAGIGAGILAQAVGLQDGIFADVGMRFSFSFALSLMMWIAVLIYWLESFRARMDGLQPLVLPLASACALLPILFPHVHLVAHVGALGFQLHFLAAMLAYSLFTLSALHAVFMGFAERKLHERSMTRSLASLPPLLTMEALLFRMLLVAFVLLSLALGSGVLYSEVLFGKAMVLDHKTLFAFASWGIFAVLLLGRHAYGWRGRKALRLTLAGFIVLLLAYVGSRFVAEVVLGRV